MVRCWIVALLLAPLSLETGCHLLLSLGGAPSVDAAAVDLGDAAATGDSLPRDAPDGAVPADLGMEHEVESPDARRPDQLPPDGPPGVLYFDDFSGAKPYTGDGTGAWAVLPDGTYQQGACTSQVTKVMIPGQSWGDVRARVRVKAEAVCPGTASAVAAVLLRVAGITNCSGNAYYWCNLDFRYPALRVGAHKGVCSTSSWGSAPTPPLQLGTWYEMELTAQGGTLVCKAWGGNLTGTVTATWTDPSPIATGSAGLYTGELTASFDDFQVELP